MDAIFFYLSFGAVALFYGYRLFILHFRPGYSQKPAKDKSLASFRWEDTNPQKLRPFKPIYHITMGEVFLLIDSFKKPPRYPTVETKENNQDCSLNHHRS